MKKCTKCLEILPRSDFYKRSETVISSKCKKCTCDDFKAKRANIRTVPENDKLILENLRRCTACEVIKATSEFYKKRNSFEGFCKVCKSNKSKEFRESDPTFSERNRATRKKYLEENPEAVEAKKIYARNYVKSRREHYNEWTRKWRRNNPEKAASYYRKWRLANLDVSTYHAQKRRAARIRATPSWAKLEDDKIRALYKQSAEMSLSEIKYNVDHIVPLQSEFVCGLHCLSNLQIITASENFMKSNQHWPYMW